MTAVLPMSFLHKRGLSFKSLLLDFSEAGGHTGTAGERINESPSPRTLKKNVGSNGSGSSGSGCSVLSPTIESQVKSEGDDEGNGVITERRASLGVSNVFNGNLLKKAVRRARNKELAREELLEVRRPQPWPTHITILSLFPSCTYCLLLRISKWSSLTMFGRCAGDWSALSGETTSDRRSVRGRRAPANTS